MKKLLSFLLLLVTANSFAQQVIIKENKDTLVLTTVKKTKVTPIKVGVITYRDSSVSTFYDTTIQTLKGYSPPSSNQSPTARAGNDATLTIPLNSSTIGFALNGSASTDPEGAVLKFFWRKVTGPQATLTDTNKVICQVTNMVEGVYDFELRAVDPLNAFTADRIIVTVKKEVGGGTSIPFSFTAIPFSDPDLNAPGRGVEDWHNQNRVNIPTEGTNTQRVDAYFRSQLTWAMLEKGQGQYDLNPLISLLNSCISKRQKISFGIMTVYHDNEPVVISYDGFRSSYPQYLHNLMQSESVKDWHNSSGWIPNYNSQHYLSRLKALHVVVNNLLETGSFNGVRYKDIVNSIDVRGYGNYGEWHNGGLVDQVSQIPSGAHATTATLKAIIDAHTSAFPNFQLSIIMTAFDANFLQHTRTSAEVGYYALTTRNNYGPLGWRRDNWGAGDGTGDTYIDDILIDNNRSFNGVPLNSLITKVWEKAPVTGEPMNSTSNSFSELEAQVRKYHAMSFGNGNITSSPNTTTKNNFRAASKASGYRIIVTGGEFTPGSASTSITTRWQNTGIAPTYDNWNIVYELVSSSGAVTTIGTSTFKLRLFLPSSNSSAHTDVFPFSIPSGTHTLRMVIKDPTGYRPPFQLAIQGRNSDGSYNIKSFQR